MRRSAVAAMLLVLLVGCARSPGAYQPADVQQGGTCDGVAAPATPSLLDATAVVTGAAVCSTEQRYLSGRGTWEFTVVRTVPDAKVPELVAALRLPDATGTVDICDARLIYVSPFVLTLSDGSRIRPGAPGDGCHTRREVLNALGTATSMTSAVRGTQVRSEWEMTTNCGNRAKSPVVWQDQTVPGLSELPALPRSGSISVCRYRGSPDQEGPLVAAGLQPAAEVAARWPTAQQVEPLRCDTPNDVTDSPPTDWLMFLRTPRPPYRLDNPGDGLIALLDLGGCGRFVDPVNGYIWSTDSGVEARLAELADQPVG